MTTMMSVGLWPMQVFSAKTNDHKGRQYLTLRLLALVRLVSSSLRWFRMIIETCFTLTRGRGHGFESGGQILRAERAEKFFLTPTFWPVGGTKYCLDR